MSGNRSCFYEKVGFNFPEFRKFNYSWLPVTEFVRATRLKNGFFSIPIPTETESHVSLRIYWTLDFRLAPGFSVVSRNFDRFDRSSARPCEAADFVKARSIQFLSARGMSDHRSR